MRSVDQRLKVAQGVHLSVRNELTFQIYLRRETISEGVCELVSDYMIQGRHMFGHPEAQCSRVGISRLRPFCRNPSRYRCVCLLRGPQDIRPLVLGVIRIHGDRLIEVFYLLRNVLVQLNRQIGKLHDPLHHGLRPPAVMDLEDPHLAARW